MSKSIATTDLGNDEQVVITTTWDWGVPTTTYAHLVHGTPALHDDKYPAIVEKLANGRALRLEYWTLQGRHRARGPAVVRMDYYHQHRDEEYWLHGKRLAVRRVPFVCA